MNFLYHIRDPKTSAGFGHDGYIGITDNLKRREAQHFTKLKQGIHRNKSLQQAFNLSNQNMQMYLVASGKKSDMEARERILVPKSNHHLNSQVGGGPKRGMSIEAALNIVRDAGVNYDNTESTIGSEIPKAKPQKESQKKQNNSGFAEAVPALGMAAACLASGLGTAYAINHTFLKHNPDLPKKENDARASGRKASYVGGSVGTVGSMAALCFAGEVGLTGTALTSGLTALGCGTAAVGVGVVLAVPAVCAGLFGIGYYFYKK